MNDPEMLDALVLGGGFGSGADALKAQIVKLARDLGLSIDQSTFDFENATDQYNYSGHSAPVKIDERTALYNQENAPELFPTVKVEFSRNCSPAAQDLVTKVWTQLLQ